MKFIKLKYKNMVFTPQPGQRLSPEAAAALNNNPEYQKLKAAYEAEKALKPQQSERSTNPLAKLPERNLRMPSKPRLDKNPEMIIPPGAENVPILKSNIPPKKQGSNVILNMTAPKLPNENIPETNPAKSAKNPVQIGMEAVKDPRDSVDLEGITPIPSSQADEDIRKSTGPEGMAPLNIPEN